MEWRAKAVLVGGGVERVVVDTGAVEIVEPYGRRYRCTDEFISVRVFRFVEDMSDGDTIVRGRE